MRLENEDADEIIPNVWIGGWAVALNEDWLRRHGIVTVFNCTKDLPLLDSIPNKYRVPIEDNLKPSEIKNMEIWAPEIAQKILYEYNQGHPILIHCYAGRQRSTTACAFFLMLLTRSPLSAVMRWIQRRRIMAFYRGVNFEPALRAFEDRLRKGAVGIRV